MNLLYTFGIHLLGFFIKLLALFNHKLKAGVVGRRNTFNVLKENLKEDDKTLWFHCASLGEFEQGLPVFEKLRAHYKSHKIVLSFFSPSGYTIKKSTPVADVVVYLPLDTKANANQFINLVNPELTVFVKYDIWPNYMFALKRKQLKAILISAAFRENQAYFKWYGTFNRKALVVFNHIFTQNEASKKLLNKISYNDVTVSGDTRFDRVYNQLQGDNTIDYLEAFKHNKLCVVCGSTWAEDEVLLVKYINELQDDAVKFVIAPHNITKTIIQKLQDNIKKQTVLFSNHKNENLETAQVFILDTIGVLSRAYAYADIAYVGGAMGTTGLHNILEPAVFGKPVIIGKNHKKFPEAQNMIDNKGVISISDEVTLSKALNSFIDSSEKRHDYGRSNFEFITKNRGATIKTFNYFNI